MLPIRYLLLIAMLAVPATSARSQETVTRVFDNIFYGELTVSHVLPEGWKDVSPVYPEDITTALPEDHDNTNLTMYAARDESSRKWTRSLVSQLQFATRSFGIKRYMEDFSYELRANYCDSLEKRLADNTRYGFGQLPGLVQVFHCIASDEALEEYDYVRRHELVAIAVTRRKQGYYRVVWTFHTNDETDLETVLNREEKTALDVLETFKLCMERKEDPCVSVAEKRRKAKLGK